MQSRAEVNFPPCQATFFCIQYAQKPKEEKEEQMKNTIPLVVAVVLGLLAVFAVSRTLSKQSGSVHGKEVSVLVANGNLKSGGMIAAENFRETRVPLAYLPKQHVLAEQKATILGQTLSRDIAAGDYIQWNDIGQSSSLGEMVGEGEWAVTVKFVNGELVKMLKPGDEIAIIGQYNIEIEKESDSPDVQKSKVKDSRSVTMVLFPQVRILGMTGRSGGGSVLLSLPPAQAMTIIATEANGVRLWASLRRPHDDKSINRKDCGRFDAQAFAQMYEGCKDITIPDQPFNKVK